MLEGAVMKFGMRLKYMLDGREVSREEWARGLVDKGVERAAESVRDRVSALKCAEHGESPTVEVQSAEGKTSLRIRSCCPALHAQAQALLTQLGAKPNAPPRQGEGSGAAD